MHVVAHNEHRRTCKRAFQDPVVLKVFAVHDLGAGFDQTAARGFRDLQE